MNPFLSTSVYLRKTLLIACLFSFQAFSQNYDWFNVFDGSTVITDLEYYSGAPYLTGVYADSIEVFGIRHYSLHQTDMFIMKPNDSGQIEFLFLFEGEGFEVLTDLEFDPAGNMILGGIYRYDAYFGGEKLGEESSYPSNPFVAKYDQNGEFLWVVDLKKDGDLEEDIRSVTIDKDGNIFALASVERLSNYLTKISPEGNVEWERSYAYELGSKIYLSEDGIINTYGSDDTGINIRAFDSFGQELLLRKLPLEGELRNIVVDGDNYILSVRLSENSYVDKLGRGAGNFVFRLDSEFNFEWGVRLGDADNYEDLELNDLAFTTESKTVVSGIFKSDSTHRMNLGDFEINTDSTNSLIAVISPSGTVEWVTSFGDNSVVIPPVSLEIDPMGNIYVGNIIVDEGNFNCEIAEDKEEARFFIAKIGNDKSSKIVVDNIACIGDTLFFKIELYESLIDFDIEFEGALKDEIPNLEGDLGYVIVNNSGTGAIKLIGVYEGNCSNRYEVVSNHFVEVIPIIDDELFIDGLESICLGEELSFYVTAPQDYNYHWSVPPEFDIVYAFQDSIVIQTKNESFESGEISLLVDNFCDAIELKKQITKNENQIVDAITPRIETNNCRESPVLLMTDEIFSATYYTWQIDYDELDQSQTLESTLPEISFTPLASNTYSESISVSVKAANACSEGAYGERLTFELLNSSNQGALVSPETACASVQNNFELIGSEYSQFEWVVLDIEGEVVESFLTDKVFNYTSDDDYSLEVYGINLCGSTLIDTDFITIESDVYPSINEDCNNLYVESKQDVKWFYGEELISTSNSVRKQKSGVYTLLVEGLCSIIEMEYSVKDPDSYFIPNVITPNGDDLNEKFVIPEDLKGSSITIVDRNGNLVYKSKSYQNDWGQNRNISNGVYFYHINNSCQSIRGYITVIR